MTKVAVLLVQGDFEVHRADCSDLKKSMAQANNYFTHEVAPGDTEYDVIASLWDDQIEESVGEGNHYATEEDAIHASYQYATKFHPCVSEIISPMPALTIKIQPSPPKRTRRTTKRSPKPGVTNTVPAKKPLTKVQARKMASDAAARNSEQAKKPSERGATPATPAANGKLTREQKRQLAHAIVTAADCVMDQLDGVGLKGVDQDEAARTVTQWLHHLPVDHGWFVQTMKYLPKPDRSDWR